MANCHGKRTERQKQSDPEGRHEASERSRGDLIAFHETATLRSRRLRGIAALPVVARNDKWQLRHSHGWERVAFFAGLLFFFVFLCSCAKREEVRQGKNGRADYAAAISADASELRALEGGAVEIGLRLKNRGKQEWSSRAKNPCLISFHLLDEKGQMLKFNNPRTALPKSALPGKKIEAEVRVKAPLDAGSYILEFDLVREGLEWFKDLGSRTLKIPLVVKKRRWPGDDIPLGLDDGKYTAFRSSVPEFERLGRLIRLTLEENEVEFQGRTGPVRGFAAGTSYPQVWLRDAATIIPGSRYYYPEEYLTSWLEEHLAFQKDSGSLEDWVDSRGRSDKNTVETDQEASAVQSAYQIFLLKGPEGRIWLEKQVAGQTILDRLEKSLLYLFAERWNKECGLITGAHTADWGDVDPEDAGPQAIYVDERTRWTADIYDQAMVYQACLELSGMFRSMGKIERADSWQKKADELRQSADRLLWQEDRGFYRVHIHIDPFPHDFDEDDMFPMGGNAQAMISGLAGAAKARKIIEAALDRQARFGVSTVSGALLPPYPGGFFKHPAMDEPYEYQNGGQWDWFGGRLLFAMFESGFSRTAKNKLLEIIRKNTANVGLWEWDTKDGAGRGSDFYAGSAGSLAKALFEGYFGIRLAENSLSLEPRLGEESATAHIYMPTAGLFAAYDYQPDAGGKKITVRYNSNFSQKGKVKVLIPRTFLGVADREQGRNKIRVYRDGMEIQFEWLSANEDDFISLETDFRDHTLEIRAVYLRPTE